MHVLLSTDSYLVRALLLLLLCLLQWTSTHATSYLKNSPDVNVNLNKLAYYQHQKFNPTEKCKGDATSEEISGLDVLYKRHKGCLLTMLALGSVAGLPDWFWKVVNELPESGTRPFPSPTRRIPTRRPTPNDPTKGVKSCETRWGTCVSGGKPDYDLTDVTYITKVWVKLVMNVWFVFFQHPITGEVIQIPKDTPDEYIVYERRQVYIIFIDRQGRTFLIFKRQLRPDEVVGGGGGGGGGRPTTIKPSQGDHPIYEMGNKRPVVASVSLITTPNTNILIIINHLLFSSNSNVKNVGSIVVQNVPKYDPTTAVFIMEANKIVINGIWVMEFVHPPTKKKVQLPVDMGDDYIIEEKIFKIFVDRSGRTFMIFVGFDRGDASPQQQEQSPAGGGGVPSVNNVPPCNIEKATRIDVVVQKVVNGIVIIEWIHPDTDEIIQSPFNIGDVYIEESTKKAYLIFVDTKGQTFLIFKGLVRTDIELYQREVGQIVIGNNPPYNIENATFIFDSKQKLGLDGKPVIEWVHPGTLRIVQIPLNIGKVYVDEKTGKVYVIFVDIRGKTYLILRGFDDKVVAFPNDNNIIGKLVINGVPKYDLDKAIIVMETVLKTLADGCTVIVFRYPITKQQVHIPNNIGDEYLDKKSQRIFSIFVDVKGTTFLIFKGWHKDIEKLCDIDPLQIGHLVKNGRPKWNLQTAIIIRKTVQIIAPDGSIAIEFRHPVIKRKILISRDEGDDYEMKETGEIFKIFVSYFQRTYLILKAPRGKEPGRKIGGVEIVIHGTPKYEISKAIIIENTEQMLDKYGRIVVFFVHPFSKAKIFLPYDRGDVYVDPRTKRVYKIVVDSREGDTLLIFVRNQGVKKEQWVTVVKGGFPAYDLSKGIYITKVVMRIQRIGIMVREYLEFRHPKSGVRLRVSIAAGADRYVKPGTQQVFVICVDNRGRTLLVFEGMKNDLLWREDPQIKWSNGTIGGTGSIVVNGLPSYDISRAIFVLRVKSKRGPDGLWIIVFKHPKTREIIRVSMFGAADEYVDKKTGRVFIIYVDRRGETLLILKPDVVRSTTIPNIPQDSNQDVNDDNQDIDDNIDNNINENINININRNNKGDNF